MTYDWFMLLQIVIAVLLYKFCNTAVSKTNSINTLVLAPIMPYLALVLFALTRVRNKDYYLGYIYALPLIVLVFIFAKMGTVIFIFSIAITVIVYGFSENIGPLIIGVFIGWLCKDMANPISFIISCNIVSNFVLTRILCLKTNKFKWEKTDDTYDNDGNIKVIAGAILEAVFIGAPSDVVSDNKDMMEGLADILCISNMLVNGSMRGSSTVIVTDWATTILFFSIIGIVYFCNTNLEYIKEEDKVWPKQYTNAISKVPVWEIIIVIATLIATYTFDSPLVVFKFVVVVILSLFVRIKVTTSLFFSTKLMFG